MRKDRPQIAVLASGNGSTFETLVHATHTGWVDAEVGLLITNNSGAGAVLRAERLNRQYPDNNIRVEHISGKTHPGGYIEKGTQTIEEAQAIYKETVTFDLVVMLGYMKKVIRPLLFKNPLNWHPGPLPETQGLFGIAVQEKVLELGMDHSASTVHHANEEYDQGNIVVTFPVPVLPVGVETAQNLFESVQSTERARLPGVIQGYLEKLEDGDF